CPRDRRGDEPAGVIAGEIPFKTGGGAPGGGPGTCAFSPRNTPHAWKNTASETGRVLFGYTPAAAGGYIEDLMSRPAGPMSERERDQLCERHRWEIVGPNPL